MRSVKWATPAFRRSPARESLARLRWIYDSQNDVVAPSAGTRAIGTVRYVFEAPDLPADFTRPDRTTAWVRWRLRRRVSGPRTRDGIGCSSRAAPACRSTGSRCPPINSRSGIHSGSSAFDIGEVRGDHYMALTGGYLRGIGRLPDFLGGPVFVGGWLENGAAYD